MGAAFTLAVELELSPTVWTDVTADTDQTAGMTANRGIPGGGPFDRTAVSGRWEFALKNVANSAALEGYYSPGHVNCRAGFSTGIGARLKVTAGTTRTLFRGTVRRILPAPGKTSLLTYCTAVDWMDDAARANVTGIATQLNKRSDEIVATVLASITNQPPATSIGLGQGTFPYALDNRADEDTKFIQILADVNRSELGFAYVKADGTFTWIGRHARAAISTNAVTFDNTMHGLQADRNDEDTFTGIRVIVHPRRVDAAPTTILASVSNVQSAIAPGNTLIMVSPYRDPDQLAQRVGGTNMQAMVAGTDYILHDGINGTGSVVTANFTVTPSYGANGVQWTITNNSTTTAGFITLLRSKGQGLYDYYNAMAIAGDVKERGLTFDMPYEDDAIIGDGAAQWLRQQYATDLTVPSVTFIANDSSTLLAAAFDQDISSRIGIKESVTGLTDVISGTTVTRGYFIQSVQWTITAGPWLVMTWALSPADRLAFWIMNQSALDVDTVLGFI